MSRNNGDEATESSRKVKITDLLTKMEEKLGTELGKVSVADYVRVIQLDRELEEDEQVRPTALKVMWIEPLETNGFEE